MIGQMNVILAGGEKRALLFPFDSIPGPSPDQYCLAVQDVVSGLVFNSVCRTIDPAKGVTEDSVKKDFHAMVAANGGAAVLNEKPAPPPPADPPAPERIAPSRRK